LEQEAFEVEKPDRFGMNEIGRRENFYTLADNNNNNNKEEEEKKGDDSFEREDVQNKEFDEVIYFEFLSKKRYKFILFYLF
jgi:hypothetical protein